MNSTGMNYQRFTTGESFDTSGSYSGEMRATSQHFNGVYRLEGDKMTHTPDMSTEDIVIEKAGIEATAMNPSGWGEADMADPNTLVTIGGIQAPISMFKELGLLEQKKDGEFKATKEVKALAKEEPTIEENPDEKIEPFHEEVEREVQEFIKAMHPVALADALDQAVNAIVKGSGDIDIETLANHSQADVNKTHDSLTTVLVANQVRAEAIMTNAGLAEQEHREAYDWARKEEPKKLQKALSQLIKNRNGNGIRKLVADYKQAQWLKGYQK